MHVCVDQRLLLGAVGRVQLPQRQHLAHGLRVVADALRLGEHVLDVRADGAAFLLQALNALEEAQQSIGGYGECLHVFTEDLGEARLMPRTCSPPATPATFSL
jgi:hypothetical protein